LLSTDGQGVSVNLVVNELWVIAGQVSDTQPIDAPTSMSDNGQAIGVWEPTDTGAVFAYAVPSRTRLELTYDATTIDGKTINGTLGFQRPIR